MPNCLLKPIANGLLMGKVLAAAPAAIPVRLNHNEKPYLSGILNEIDKSRTKLTFLFEQFFPLTSGPKEGLLTTVLDAAGELDIINTSLG